MPALALAMLLLAGADRQGVASAQTIDDGTRAAARALAEQGLSLYDAGKYALALDRFNRADAVVHAPTMGLMAARCLEKLGRLVESAERYRAVTRVPLPADAPEAQRAALANAAKERDALLPRIPTLQIDVAGSGVAVTVDGKPMSEVLVGARNPTDPGHHRVEARRGEALATKELNVEEGAAATVLLDPSPGIAPVPSAAAPPVEESPDPEGGGTRRFLGVAALGLGGAGLVLGVVTGVLVLGKQHDLEAKGCAAGTCPPALADDVHSYATMRTLSTAGVVGGLVLAAGGATLLLTAPRAKRGGVPAARAWEPWLGPAAAGVRGVF